MGSSGLQLGAVALLFIGTLLAIIATFNNSWARSDVSGNVMESLRNSWGLWMRCQHTGVGLNTCDHYDKVILGNPIELILSRGFMIVGIVCGFSSIIAMLAGAECATIISDPQSKKKTRCIAGVLGLTGGALILVTGILISVIITKDYHHANYMVTVQQGGFNNFRGRRAEGADNKELDLVPLSDNKELQKELLANIPECADEDCTKVAPKKNARFANTGRSGGGGNAMVFGMGVIMAWAAGLIMLVAGGLMLSQGCGGSDRYDDDYNPGYQTTQSNQYPTKNSGRNNEYL